MLKNLKDLNAQFEQFLHNEFRHASQDIAYLKGQMKLVLAGLSAILLMMSAIVAGLAIEVLK